ncbi:50S ribosomal protein L11 methyltransferase [Christensenellaceae bacterium OttesenSCG-928-M15]|nr:50S ribosomal protein L11 methyltransferase [Christensenellaceae bacterium OttesenSCG-928-M15]
MRYIEFAVYTTDMGIEPVLGALSRAGLNEVSIEESADRIEAHLRELRPYWDFADAAALASESGPCVKAYIADLSENAALLDGARHAISSLRSMEFGFDIGPLTIVESKMDEEDWANNWKKYYKPMPVGEKLLICPSWEQAEPAGRRVLYLDPGMVFGTGAHYTTRMCLELLETAVTEDCRVLDIGCGSGILGIAAEHLGAKESVLVDVDPVAERVVTENYRMNGYPACNVYIGDILHDSRLKEQVAGQYDVVCANIVADVIIALCKEAIHYVKRNGYFLCSGIIDERADEVEAALQANGFSIQEKVRSASDPDGNPLDTAWVAYKTVLSIS